METPVDNNTSHQVPVSFLSWARNRNNTYALLCTTIASLAMLTAGGMVVVGIELSTGDYQEAKEAAAFCIETTIEAVYLAAVAVVYKCSTSNSAQPSNA